MSFAGQLDKTVDVKDFTGGAADGMGGQAAGTWATIYKHIKGAVVIIHKGEQILSYDKKNVFAEFYWYFDYLSGFREGQRIHWGSRIYEVKLVLPWQEKGRFAKLACIEIARKI